MRTPYGEPSGALTFGEFAGAEVVFLARHGYGHTLSPHEINYRANIWALKELKVEGVIAVATVGGIRADLIPGTLVLPDQIIDYTHSRKSTFFEGSEMPVTHVDFTQPYSQRAPQAFDQPRRQHAMKSYSTARCTHAHRDRGLKPRPRSSASHAKAVTSWV